MNNELSTKLYKLDFKELVDNATNKAYWNKKWEIFNYDGMSVEFFLESISIVHNKLNGKIRLNGGGDCWRNPESLITIPLQEDNFNKTALERELVGRVDSIFLEQGCIDLKKTEEYRDIEILEEEFVDRLKDIAREFLNSNNIYNNDIRDLYICDYISNNEKDYTSDYINEKKYSTYVSHRATFAYIMGFDDKAERIISDSGEVDLEYILEQAEELKLQLEDGDFEEYESNLEDL